MDNNKIIHDMNSTLSSLEQAIMLINSNFEKDPAVTKKVLNLTEEKIKNLFDCWAIIKNQLKH